MNKILIQRQKSEPKEPTKEQAQGWLNQPTGKYFKATLFERLEDLKDGWVNGEYTGESTEETAQRNSEAIGKAQAIAETIYILEEMVEDEQSSEDEQD